MLNDFEVFDANFKGFFPEDSRKKAMELIAGRPDHEDNLVLAAGLVVEVLPPTPVVNVDNQQRVA